MRQDNCLNYCNKFRNVNLYTCYIVWIGSGKIYLWLRKKVLLIASCLLVIGIVRFITIITTSITQETIKNINLENYLGNICQLLLTRNNNSNNIVYSCIKYNVVLFFKFESVAKQVSVFEITPLIQKVGLWEIQTPVFFYFRSLRP